MEGHKGNECKSKISCRRCKKPNHCDIFCKKNFEKGTGFEAQNKFPDRKTKLEASRRESKKDENKKVERVVPFNRMRSANLATETNGASFQVSKILKHDDQPKPTLEDEVLLTFASVHARNPEDMEINQSLIAFFDTGASFSFINKEVAKIMKLPILYRTKVAIFTFGQTDRPQLKEYTVHQLMLTESFGSRRVINVYACLRWRL